MTHQVPTSPIRAPDVVFTREAISMPGQIAATAADALKQIAQGKAEGDGRDAETKTSNGGMETPPPIGT